MPVVRVAAVKSLEIDPAPPPPPATASRKETAEVSYAKPSNESKGTTGSKDAGDKGKGC